MNKWNNTDKYASPKYRPGLAVIPTADLDEGYVRRSLFGYSWILTEEKADEIGIRFLLVVWAGMFIGIGVGA